MNETNLLRPAGIRKITGVAGSDTKTVDNAGYPVFAAYCRNSENFYFNYGDGDRIPAASGAQRISASWFPVCTLAVMYHER